MRDFQSYLDDSEALAKAFRAIQLKPKEKADLGELYARPIGIPVTRDKSNCVRGETVFSCSRVGRYLTSHFGGIRPGDLMMWVGYIDAQSDLIERWIMRPQVRSAIEKLGWFPLPATRTESQAPEPRTMEEVLRELEAGIAASASGDRDARLKRLLNAPVKPRQLNVTATAYRRNSDVIVEALYRAAGNCERCGKLAPFLRASDKSPYLEVHHRIPLSRNGDDTLENAIALCPNCHRKDHYA
jgi:hypothetical protein